MCLHILLRVLGCFEMFEAKIPTYCTFKQISPCPAVGIMIKCHDANNVYDSDSLRMLVWQNKPNLKGKIMFGVLSLDFKRFLHWFWLPVQSPIKAGEWNQTSNKIRLYTSRFKTIYTTWFINGYSSTLYVVYLQLIFNVVNFRAISEKTSQLCAKKPLQ